jgi:tryptophan-rich sensory protein
MPHTAKRALVPLVGFLGASYGAAALGSAFTLPALSPWYRELRKPGWTPPDQVFGPVWTGLYTLMAVAAWLVHRAGARQPSASRAALQAWFVQLCLNVGWSAAFFGARSPRAGLLVIVPLDLAIARTVILTASVTRVAATLLLPYLAWTAFATALNARIWQLNRTQTAQNQASARSPWPADSAPVGLAKAARQRGRLRRTRWT